ncbi:MAG: hypothetical protein FWH27_06800 [Planctomycetaceae bacterium]|nr:hypothetical protein [Planctomycetaceae bacterium]
MPCYRASKSKVDRRGLSRTITWDNIVSPYWSGEGDPTGVKEQVRTGNGGLTGTCEVPTCPCRKYREGVGQNSGRLLCARGRQSGTSYTSMVLPSKVKAKRGIASVGKSERFDSTVEVGEPCARWGVEGGKRIVEILDRFWETYKCLDI